MASGALPPGFPAIEIDGEYYWDGGLVSNTPLQWVVDTGRARTRSPSRSICGAPRRVSRATWPRSRCARRKSSIRAAPAPDTDRFKNLQRMATLAMLENCRRNCAISRNTRCSQPCRPKVYNIVHLIYHARHYEGHSKDYEFSRSAWRNIGAPAITTPLRTLRQPEVFQRPDQASRRRLFCLRRSPRQRRYDGEGAPCSRKSRRLGDGRRRSPMKESDVRVARFAMPLTNPGLSARALPVLQSRISDHHLPHRSARSCVAVPEPLGSTSRS